MPTAAGSFPRGAKPGARSHLLNYGWPGNVRELEHAIHRAVVLARATRAGDEVVLEAQHFALQDEGPAPQAAEVVAEIPQHHNLREATESFQREIIRRALAQIITVGRQVRGRWKQTLPTCTGWRNVWV